MTTDEKIADEQLQYRIYKEAAKISALSSGKIDKYEYLKGQELLPTDSSLIIKYYIYLFSFRKSFIKTNKIIEDQSKSNKRNEK